VRLWKNWTVLSARLGPSPRPLMMAVNTLWFRGRARLTTTLWQRQKRPGGAQLSQEAQ
jgi:hypothetical protein